MPINQFVVRATDQTAEDGKHLKACIWIEHIKDKLCAKEWKWAQKKEGG